MFFGLIIVGCAETPFKIYAVYHAPISQFTINIKTEGTVPYGADMADSCFIYAEVIPDFASTGNHLNIFWDLSPTIKYKTGSNNIEEKEWNFRTYNDVLNDILKNAEYIPNKDEVEDFVRVIRGNSGGPKGVIMKGQVKHLEVKSVSIN